MMAISRKVRYALRALYALARQPSANPVLIAELAEAERIPRKFLEVILLELRNAGILHSKKGRGGGYALARSPETITLGEIIRALDGPIAPIPCARDRGFVKCEECDEAETCGTRMVMREVRDAMVKILDGTSLAAVLRKTEVLGAHKGVAYSI